MSPWGLFWFRETNHPMSRKDERCISLLLEACEQLPGASVEEIYRLAHELSLPLGDRMYVNLLRYLGLSSDEWDLLYVRSWFLWVFHTIGKPLVGEEWSDFDVRTIYNLHMVLERVSKVRDKPELEALLCWDRAEGLREGFEERVKQLGIRD